MRTEVQPYTRRVEILRLLHEQGPLSVSGLKYMIEPEMRAKNINIALSRLRKRGYVLRRFDSLPDNVGHFYQLSYSKKVRAEISQILGKDIAELEDPQIRDQELYHSQQCALWMHYIKKAYPEAHVVRDFQILQDESARKVLMMDHTRLDLTPDILLILPKKDGCERVRIAFEIERSRKSNARIVDKLKKYAHSTFLDGVIYVCSHSSIEESIADLYNKNVRQKIFRFAYRENFLMFMSSRERPYLEGASVYNPDFYWLELKDWIDYLRSKTRTARRDLEINMLTNNPTIDHLRPK